MTTSIRPMVGEGREHVEWKWKGLFGNGEFPEADIGGCKLTPPML